MDNRLDFFNDVNRYIESMTDDDSMLILWHNKEDGDYFAALCGEWEILSAVLSEKDYVKEEDNKVGSYEEYKNIREGILSIAYNILMKDEPLKQFFLNKLT